MIETIIDEILEREGYVYTDHPEDRGGPTKFGITQTTLSAWLKRPASKDDVRGLTEATARSIYRHQYIKAPNFDQIEAPWLQELVIDCGVNHGVHRAAKWLQLAIGNLRVDGVVGPKTLAALAASDQFKVYLRLIAMRVRFYGEIITEDWKQGRHQQARFAAGWARRAASFLDQVT